MPQTVQVTGGQDNVKEPRTGDVVVSHYGRTIYMVTEMCGGGSQWVSLQRGTLHNPGDMSFRQRGSDEPYWRILEPGELVTLEI